jgi:hypothetical protein
MPDLALAIKAVITNTYITHHYTIHTDVLGISQAVDSNTIVHGGVFNAATGP